MKSKAEKAKEVEGGLEALKNNQTVIFGDFTGSAVGELTKLRRILKEVGAKFIVTKKRLFAIMFKQLGLELDLKKLGGQVGAVVAPKDISEVAGAVYRFSKESAALDKREKFKILGGYNLAEKRFLEMEEVVAIGMLPSRDVLLGQLLGMVSSPLKMFLNILDQKSKQSVK